METKLIRTHDIFKHNNTLGTVKGEGEDTFGC